MNRKERLTATLRGEEVDRPPVNFYEVGGFVVDPGDPDPFNIYNDPSWKALLQMAEERTDLIRMVNPVRKKSHQAWEGSGKSGSRDAGCFRVRETVQGSRKFVRTSVETGGKVLTSVQFRDVKADTAWTVEPLLKGSADLEAFLTIPDEAFEEHIETASLFRQEELLGGKGIVMVDTEDPLCAAATLFSLEQYALTAMKEPVLFHTLLEKCARYIQARTERTTREFPGRLWRIYGAEFAAPPYLPPELFKDYEVRYTQPMIDAVHATGGFVRIHCHGMIRDIIDMIVAMGPDALDPVEPPPQGDMELGEVRARYGGGLVLFGNLQASSLERSGADTFRKEVEKALCEGTKGRGRGFVLMPTAGPFQRTLPEKVVRNFEIMLDVVEGFTG